MTPTKGPRRLTKMRSYVFGLEEMIDTFDGSTIELCLNLWTFLLQQTVSFRACPVIHLGEVDEHYPFCQSVKDTLYKGDCEDV